MTALERFRSHVDTSGGPGACHPWTAGRDQDGYGFFWLTPRKSIRASRFALSMKLGRDLGPGEKTRHTCDNPPCCNDAHLVPGTHADNMADRDARGRTARGERHWNAKLTAETAALAKRLCAEGVSRVAVARMLGVGSRAISHVATGTNWKSLEASEAAVSR